MTRQPIDGPAGAMPGPNFRCSNGHEIYAADLTITVCPVGRCTGELTRVGPGSRKEAKQDA